jgi:predicted ATPase/DNA-binding winged helix-turn-helix (wHTH) protein
MKRALAASLPAIRIEPENEWAWWGEQRLELTPKGFAVLRYLVAHAGRLVTKEELLSAVWSATVVSEATLTSAIRDLRGALHETAAAPRYIETVHRRGFRFIGPVAAAEPETEARIENRKYHTESDQTALRSESSGVVSAAHPAPIVGRDAELARLQVLLADALSGQRRLIFVTGEAGIGKTTVVDAFLARAAVREQAWIGRGQCIEQYGAGEAYLPVLEALGRLGRGPRGERLVHILRQYAPAWLLQLPALMNDAELEAVQRRAQGATRERMLRELVEALDLLTTLAPLVLVLEDLHWSDYATIDILSMLARRREAARLLVIGTYRPAELAIREHRLKTAKRELQLHGHCQELPLGFLSAAAVAEYVERRFPRHQLPVQLARQLHHATDGNPLFVVNTVDYLVAEQTIREAEGRWQLMVPLETLTISVPETLRQLIEKHIERLTADERQALAVASVAGTEFSAAVLTAGGMEAQTGEAVCEGLVRRGQFLRRTGTATWPDGTVVTRYGFIHALYQNVLYERVPAGQRMEWHRQVGKRLEGSYGTRAGEIATELAMHFEHGQEVARAVHYRRQAGETALRHHAHHEAATHVTRGLELLMTLPDTLERAQQELALQMTLGVALMATKGFSVPEVEQAYARARVLCQQLGNTPQLFPALYGLWSFHLTRAELHTARALGEQLFRLAEASQDATLLLQAHQVLGITFFFQGEFVAAHEHLQQALTLYDPYQHRPLAFLYGHDPGVVCLGYAMWALWLLGFPAQALQRSREGVALAREFIYAPSLASALHFTANIHNWRGEWPTAQRCAEEVLTLATEQELPFWRALATVGRGWAFVGHGRVEEGSAQIRQGIDAFSAMGATLGRSTYLCMLAEAYSKMGRVEEGLNLLAKELELSHTTGERWYEAELYRLKGELLLQRGRPADQ